MTAPPQIRPSLPPYMDPTQVIFIARLHLVFRPPFHLYAGNYDMTALNTIGVQFNKP